MRIAAGAAGRKQGWRSPGRRTCLSTLSLVSALVIFGLAASAAPARNVYVPNANDDDVAVIDTATNTKAPADINVGGNPRAIAITPDGQRAYVTNAADDDVSVIDVGTNEKAAADIPVGAGPIAIAITPNGQRAYVANVTDTSVSVINTAAGTTIANDIPVDSVPESVAITPNGALAYVANSLGRSVSVIDTATNQVIGDGIPFEEPTAMAVNPDGARAYVLDEVTIDSDTFGAVLEVDTATNTKLFPELFLGRPRPSAIAITPNGERAYVPDELGDDVVVLDADSGSKISDDIPVGNVPRAVAISPDGESAYVVNQFDATVSLIDTSSNTRLADIVVGQGAGAIAITPNQPPEAALSATRNEAAPANEGETFVAEIGERVSFDASVSSDPDGQIDAYAWSFGDGQEAVDGPVQAHNYAAPGTYTATLKLTDDEGCSTDFVFTGQTASCNGSALAEATQEVEVVTGPSLSLRARKKQKAKRLMVKVYCGALPCEAKVRGKAKLPRKGKKAKTYKLKTRTVPVKEGKTRTVKLKFNRNQKSSKKIEKLLKRDKKARKRNKLTVNVEAIGPAGGTDRTRQTIRLKQ